MEQYLALLFFIVPGFITVKTYELLSRKGLKKEAFETTVSSLIFSAATILVSFVLLIKFSGLKVNPLDISVLFASPRFVAKYAVLTLIISVYIGFMWNEVCPFLIRIINGYRASSGKTKCETSSVFESCFDDGSEHLIKITHEGAIQIGFLDSYRLEEGVLKEIRLIDCENGKRYIEAIPLKEKAQYSNNESVIIEYDISDFYVSKKNKWILRVIIDLATLIIVFVALITICRRFL